MSPRVSISNKWLLQRIFGNEKMWSTSFELGSQGQWKRERGGEGEKERERKRLLISSDSFPTCFSVCLRSLPTLHRTLYIFSPSVHVLIVQPVVVCGWLFFFPFAFSPPPAGEGGGGRGGAEIGRIHPTPTVIKLGDFPLLFFFSSPIGRVGCEYFFFFFFLKSRLSSSKQGVARRSSF